MEYHFNHFSSTERESIGFYGEKYWIMCGLYLMDSDKQKGYYISTSFCLDENLEICSSIDLPGYCPADSSIIEILRSKVKKERLNIITHVRYVEENRK